MKSTLTLVTILALNISILAHAEILRPSTNQADAGMAEGQMIRNLSNVELFNRYYVLLDTRVSASDVVTSLVRRAPVDTRANLFLIRQIISQTPPTSERQNLLGQLNRAFNTEVTTMYYGLFAHVYWRSKLEDMALKFVPQHSTLANNPAVVTRALINTKLTDLMGLTNIVPSNYSPSPTAALSVYTLEGFAYNAAEMTFFKIN